MHFSQLLQILACFNPLPTPITPGISCVVHKCSASLSSVSTKGSGDEYHSKYLKNMSRCKGLCSWNATILFWNHRLDCAVFSSWQKFLAMYLWWTASLAKKARCWTWRMCHCCTEKWLSFLSCPRWWKEMQHAFRGSIQEINCLLFIYKALCWL